LAGCLNRTAGQRQRSGAGETCRPGEQQKNWEHWGNTTHGDRFAALDQINKQNVSQLKVAWVAHTGDIPQSNGSGAEDQNTPLQIGDTLYVCTPYSKVLALDVDSGKEKWRYDSKPPRQTGSAAAVWAILKSQAHATSGTQPAACSRRLFLPTTDARLIAINADNGKVCEDFGDHGIVDLSVGMGEIKAGYYQQTSTPLVAGNVVVVGGRVADNFSTGEPPGVVRAYDVHTGKLAWAWDPGNPNLTGLPPEGQTYTRGTPNVWSAMSYDAKLNLIYLPTGNATPDFWAANVPRWTINTAPPSSPLMPPPARCAGISRPPTTTCGTLTCLPSRCCTTCLTVRAAPRRCWCRPASRA
jgi:quinate dehydrogenase (quinone)